MIKYFKMIKNSIHQEPITVLTVYAPGNIALKYIKWEAGGKFWNVYLVQLLSSFLPSLLTFLPFYSRSLLPFYFTPLFFLLLLLLLLSQK